MTSFPVGTSPTTDFIDAQRYGSLLVVAQFVVYQKGTPVGGPWVAAVSTGPSPSTATPSSAGPGR